MCVLGVSLPAIASTPAWAAAVQISATPAMFPAFAPNIPNYAVRCMPQRRVRMSALAPRGLTVSIDGRRARSGQVNATLRLSSGQAFRFVVKSGGRGARYLIRCLPSDFPQWTAERLGRPQAAWYVLAPCCVDKYAVIFDNHGVPVWWLHTRRDVLDDSLLPDGDVAVGLDAGDRFGYGLSLANFEEYNLDGTYERTFTIPHGVHTDRHVLEVLPSGNYIAVAHLARPGVDLQPYGGPASATVLDGYIAVVSPRRKLIWSWNSKDHIGLDESSRWYPTVLPYHATLKNGTAAYDIVHINAVVPYGRNFLVSMRHTDAVYDIARSTGNVIWKLGGTPTPQSLKIIGDTVPDFGGQHDVRVLPDGTVTLLDNGTGRGRAPRALRFRIDPRAKTATLIEDLVDRQTTPDSPCCGSARKLPGGDWVVSWGGTDLVTELTPSDTPVFDLGLPQEISFRAQPILPGGLSRRALNAAMDKRFPRGP